MLHGLAWDSFGAFRVELRNCRPVWWRALGGPIVGVGFP